MSRRWFALFQAENPESLTDVERAARFFYLKKTAFGGLVRRQSYHYPVATPPNLGLARLPEILDNAHRRLARVQIECLPYAAILDRYDRPESLFYLDPPDWGRELYRFNVSDADFVELARRLASVRANSFYPSMMLRKSARRNSLLSRPDSCFRSALKPSQIQVLTLPNGLSGRDFCLDSMKGRKQGDLDEAHRHAFAGTAELTGMQVRMFGDVAIVTGQAALRDAKYNGKDVFGDYLFRDVFVRRGGRWQVVASHSNKVQTGM